MEFAEFRAAEARYRKWFNELANVALLGEASVFLSPDCRMAEFRRRSVSFWQ